MPHNHSHPHGGEGNIGVAFFLNLSFTVVELAGGILTNSIAIISDAAHDFGDSLALGLAWYFQKLSKKGSNNRYTYGYKRFSLLGAVINSVVLLVGSAYILTEAVPRIFAPQPTDATGMLALAAVGIAVNGAAVLRTRKAKTINERFISLHLLEDVLGWGAVLAGAVVMRFTGWTVIDPLLSVAIAAFVLFNVFRNVRQALPILLQRTPAGVSRERIAEGLEALAHVGGVHDLHIWSLDEEYNVMTVHIVLTEPLSAEETAALKGEARAFLGGEGVQHATIEFEAPGETCGLLGCV